MTNAATVIQADSRVAGGWFAQVPNAISILRLSAALPLVVLAYDCDKTAFTSLLLGSLVSDIADGFIARAFHLTTVLGAKLDSIADQLTSIAAVAGLFAFELTVMREHWLAFAMVVSLYLTIDVAALWQFGRIASLHTYLSRIAAYMQGIFIMTLLIWGYQVWTLRAMVAISIAAYCEELVIILRVLPEWRANVRGLWWLLRQGAQA
jgi:phosphatidylglycerophosphate synthase